MPPMQLIVVVSVGLVVATSGAFADEPLPDNAPAERQAAAPSRIMPRLSRPLVQYYKDHPEEYRQFVARLPQRVLRPTRPAPSKPPWQAVRRSTPADSLDNPLLLTDGTVLVHQACSRNWYKLTPDATGSYVNGTWSKIAPLPSGYAPEYFASQVLGDGRVVVNGGEYNIDCTENSQPVWTNRGAIYDPVADSWTSVPPPNGWSSIGDAQSVVLADGRYMLANALTRQQALLNPGTLTWARTGTGKFDANDEEGWTLLPDGTVLTADGYTDKSTCGRNTERYSPATGAWHSAGNSPVQLSDCSGRGATYEVGPQVLRADGSVVSFSGVATGAVAGTSILNTSHGTWRTGPKLPTINGQRFDLADAPAAWTTTGQILFAASPGFNNMPTHFFLFSPTNGGSEITRVPDTPNASAVASFEINFLMLPTGQILETDLSSDVEIYSPSGAAATRLRPTIASVATTLARGHRYQIRGEQLAGVSSGATYGDDAQAGTNFPLVRIVNNATHHVFYARTSGFSSRSVAPKAASSASFLVPAAGRIETGRSALYVVANGVSSDVVAVTVK